MMNIGILLSLRFEFTEIVKEFQIDSEIYHGTIAGLKLFLENGHKKNRFRPNFNRAIEIAKEILEDSGNGTQGNRSQS